MSENKVERQIGLIKLREKVERENKWEVTREGEERVECKIRLQKKWSKWSEE